MATTRKTTKPNTSKISKAVAEVVSIAAPLHLVPAPMTPQRVQQLCDPSFCEADEKCWSRLQVRTFEVFNGFKERIPECERLEADLEGVISWAEEQSLSAIQLRNLLDALRTARIVFQNSEGTAAVRIASRADYKPHVGPFFYAEEAVDAAAESEFLTKSLRHIAERCEWLQCEPGQFDDDRRGALAALAELAEVLEMGGWNRTAANRLLYYPTGGARGVNVFQGWFTEANRIDRGSKLTGCLRRLCELLASLSTLDKSRAYDGTPREAANDLRKAIAILSPLVMADVVATPPTSGVIKQELKTNEPVATVTADQIAKLVYLESKSLERYRSEWPPPEVRASGRRKAQWIYESLLPTLKKQFPLAKLPDSLPLAPAP